MTAGRLFDKENRGDRADKGDHPAGNLEGELDRGLHARLRRAREGAGRWFEITDYSRLPS